MVLFLMNIATASWDIDIDCKDKITKGTYGNKLCTCINNNLTMTTLEDAENICLEPLGFECYGDIEYVTGCTPGYGCNENLECELEWDYLTGCYNKISDSEKATIFCDAMQEKILSQTYENVPSIEAEVFTETGYECYGDKIYVTGCDSGEKCNSELICEERNFPEKDLFPCDCTGENYVFDLYGLQHYPAPIVIVGTYDENTALIVDDNSPGSDFLALADIAANLQYESVSNLVIGGVTDQVLIGDTLTDTDEYGNQYFDETLQNDEISKLFDGEISFKGSNYDTSEELEFVNGGPFLSGENLVALRTEERDMIKFNYKFDETIDLTETLASTPLIIEFMGDVFEITNVPASGDTFTAFVGKEYYMIVGETLYLDIGGTEKTITLDEVNASSVIVSINEVSETINAGSPEIVQGTKIRIEKVFSKVQAEESSAALVIGSEISETILDEDAYVGEDETDPDWVWDISGLATAGVDQQFGIENDFTNNPAFEGECLALPNDYVGICFNSLTEDESYGNIVIQGSTTITPIEQFNHYVLASEVSDVTAQNLYLIWNIENGNDVITPFVETIFGIGIDDWTYSEGESLIWSVENGEYTAILVAGTTSDDVRRAAKVLANHNNYDFCGNKMLVTSTNLEDMEIETIDETCMETETEECTIDEDCDTGKVCENNVCKAELIKSECSDKIDNDGDGLIDSNDLSCFSEDDESETETITYAELIALYELGLTECMDGIDNDGDGLIDFPEETECVSLIDNDEDWNAECMDGISNDDDETIDLDDMGCSNPNDNTEKGMKNIISRTAEFEEPGFFSKVWDAITFWN